jgi:hypothetical protein
MEAFFPLRAYVCESCFLVQVMAYEPPESIFRDYSYFSSYSSSWLAHCERYVEGAVRQLGLDGNSRVIEAASNDGYLLSMFRDRGISALGIEPARNIAKVAREKGIETISEFFGVKLAGELRAAGRLADLWIGNNVLAHVPDINDFIGGIRLILAEGGAATLEFPHLLELARHNQFDTIYHEHFSYLSLGTVRRMFAAHGLEVFRAEQLPTHGGSLRVYAQREGGPRGMDKSVGALLRREREAGMEELSFYTDFNLRVRRVKRDILRLLFGLREKGASLAAYGAPAKGNTLLNYCGIGTDLIEYTVDISPHKQNALLPGSRIPVYHPGKIRETKPDYLVILPWNIREEIAAQCAYIREWGGKFVTLIPEAKVF